MNIIVAVDNNWGIGFNGNLLEKIPKDMKRFKEKTIGKTVIMGRVTFESLPNKEPLIDRKNIVLSKNYISSKDISIYRNIEDFFNNIKKIDLDEVYVIGGEQIYKLFLPFCKKAFVTKIYNTYKSDKKMVNLDNEINWKIIEESIVFETKKGIKYQFVTYENINILIANN